jgi:MSHA biogenesis protein MshP
MKPRGAGFALMAALFIIVTLAAIGVYLLTISIAQVEAGVQDEQGARAYQAARTGVEWGTFQLLQNTAGPFATACAAAPFAQPIPLTQGLTGFTSNVACQQVGSETEGGITVTVYRLTVTGCNRAVCPAAAGAADATYVQRQLQLTVSRET